MQLTDNPNSCMILRDDVNDPGTQTRIALPAGAQLIVDSERMWHSVWHVGDDPRYCLINSFESGPELEKWIVARDPVTKVESATLPARFGQAQEIEAQALPRQKQRAPNRTHGRTGGRPRGRPEGRGGDSPRSRVGQLEGTPLG